MATTKTLCNLVEVRMQPVSFSTYRFVKTGEYRQPDHSFKYSPVLTKTGRNYYDSKEQIPEGSRMSTSAEELSIQLCLEMAGQDPRKAAVFNDLFARGDVGYVWQWTETGLRIPNGWEKGKYQTDAKGNIQFPRIVLIGDQEVGEALVPEGNGRVVVEWNEVFGIPSLTVGKGDATDPKNHTTHFYLNVNPNVDERTGRQDIAVGRGGGWLRGGRGRGLDVSADIGRSAAYSDSGFRQVQGSVPVIEKSVLGSESVAVQEGQVRTYTETEYRQVVGELAGLKARLRELSG